MIGPMSDARPGLFARWNQNHGEATLTLRQFAESGDVDWEQLLADQEAMLDALLTAQDRQITRKRTSRSLRRIAGEATDVLRPGPAKW